MTINCVWEHNGRDTLLYAVDFVGAYTRGETLEAAVRKMQAEICSYLKWCGKKAVTSMDIVIIEEKVSELAICDADSDVLFESEKAPLTAEEYIKLKALALKSAQDFLALYDSVPDKNATAAPERKTFYGQVPRTANEMYEHSWFTSLYIKGTEKQPYMGVQLFQAFGLTFRLAVTNAEKGNDRGDVLKRQRVGIFCPQNTQ